MNAFLILLVVWLGSPLLVLAGLWIVIRRVSERTSDAPSIGLKKPQSAEVPGNERKAA